MEGTYPFAITASAYYIDTLEVNYGVNHLLFRLSFIFSNLYPVITYQ